MRSRRPMHEWRRGGSKIPELQSFSNSLLRPRLVLAQTLTASWAKIKIIPPIQAGFGDVRALRTIAVAYLDACQIRPTLQITELSMRKVHMPLAADLRRLVLRTPLKWGRCAAPVVLLLHAVLSWSTGLAAERQADRADQPPDYWAETDGGQVQWMDNNTTSILRSTCSPYSTLWARANLSGYTVVWNHALALRDTFLVLIDSTGADLPPAQVVQNFLNPERGEFSNELKRSLESLTWTPITSDWDTLVVPQGSVVIVNPSEPDIHRASIDMELGLGNYLIPSLSWQDTLLFFFESGCTSVDTVADISDDDTVDSADSSSVDSGLSAELLSIVELWSDEYLGTGRREYSEWLTFSGESNGFAPWDSTATTIYNADNPIRVRMVLEDETVFAVYIDVPGRFQRLRKTLDLESFEPGSADSDTYISMDSEAGTHLGSDSMGLGIHLSMNFTDGVYITRESDGAIRGEVSFAQHRDLAPYHSKETVHFVVYPRNSDTLLSERETGQVPEGSYLYQNAPNPFNGSTVLRYDLDREQPVKLVIYSLGGQRVVQLVDTVQMPGYYELIWDGRDGNGRRLASGLYLARLLADQVVETRKLLLIR